MLLGIELGDCRKVTDVGITALGTGCGKLQSIDLSGCYMVTDAGVTACEIDVLQLTTSCTQRCDTYICYFSAISEFDAQEHTASLYYIYHTLIRYVAAASQS